MQVFDVDAKVHFADACVISDSRTATASAVLGCAEEPDSSTMSAHRSGIPSALRSDRPRPGSPRGRSGQQRPRPAHMITPSTTAAWERRGRVRRSGRAVRGCQDRRVPCVAHRQELGEMCPMCMPGVRCAPQHRRVARCVTLCMPRTRPGPACIGRGPAYPPHSRAAPGQPSSTVSVRPPGVRRATGRAVRRVRRPARRPPPAR
jgi:hypothetical protein